MYIKCIKIKDYLKKRANYIILGKALTNLFISIVDIFRKDEKSDTLTLINMIFGVLGSKSEILILHFCNFDKKYIRYHCN